MPLKKQENALILGRRTQEKMLSFHQVITRTLGTWINVYSYERKNYIKKCQFSQK